MYKIIVGFIVRWVSKMGIEFNVCANLSILFTKSNHESSHTNPVELDCMISVIVIALGVSLSVARPSIHINLTD